MGEFSADCSLTIPFGVCRDSCLKLGAKVSVFVTQIGYKSNLRNSQSITDLREGGPASLTGSPTSLIGSSGTGGVHDSSASGRTWGSAKDRGKIRRADRPHHLYRSLDVTQTQAATATTVTTTRTPRPVQVDRLTDTPSPPPVFRWNGAACYSQPHASLALWARELEDEEASFSCDSLDPSLAAESATAARQSTAATPSPSPSCPTPRKRWHSPAESRRPSMMGYDDASESSAPTAREPSGVGANDDQALVPRFVCWELPFSSLRSDGGTAKPLVRVQPRMRSEANRPAAHKCDLKTRKLKPNRSRTSSRDRAARAGSCAKSGPVSMPAVPCPSTQPTNKWTRRINVQQLLPSKARFSSSSLDVRADGQTRRGTLHRAIKQQTFRTRCMIRVVQVELFLEVARRSAAAAGMTSLYVLVSFALLAQTFSHGGVESAVVRMRGALFVASRFFTRVRLRWNENPFSFVNSNTAAQMTCE